MRENFRKRTKQNEVMQSTRCSIRMMFNELSENVNREVVSLNKDIETIQKNQSEINNTITELKNTLK